MKEASLTDELMQKWDELQSAIRKLEVAQLSQVSERSETLEKLRVEFDIMFRRAAVAAPSH